MIQPRVDRVAIADHLRALYGAEAGDAPGFLSVFMLPSRATVTVPGDALFGDAINQLAALAATENLYIGVGLLGAPPAEGRRGSAGDVIAVPGLWLDLDIAGPHHRGTKYPRSRLDACDFLAELPIEPSLVVATGGGLHVYWLFRELAVFANDNDRHALGDLSGRFQRAIRARAVARGWEIDNTSDLARILRPAGTLNHKSDPPTPVVTMWRSDVRYEPADFEAVAKACPATKPNSGSIPTTAPLSARGETVKTLIATAKAQGYSTEFIVDAIDRRIRAYIGKVGTRGEGSRNAAAYQISVFLLNDLAAAPEIVLGYLVEWNTGNSPPLAESELRATFRSAQRGGQRPVGCAHDPRGSAA